MDVAAAAGDAGAYLTARKEFDEAQAKVKLPSVGKPLSRTVVKHELIPEEKPSPLGVRHYRELDDGTKEWFRGNKYHRPEEEGPARIWANGNQEYFRNGKWHRQGGPALIDADGTQTWMRTNSVHRTDGPAVINADGTEEWWFNNKQETEEYVRKITSH